MGFDGGPIMVRVGAGDGLVNFETSEYWCAVDASNLEILAFKGHEFRTFIEVAIQSLRQSNKSIEAPLSGLCWAFFLTLVIGFFVGVAFSVATLRVRDCPEIPGVHEVTILKNTYLYE